MLRRLTASCAFVHLLQLYSFGPSFSGLVNLVDTEYDQRIKNRCQFTRVPPQTPRQRILPSSDLPTLSPQLQTDIQHRIDCARHISTPLARHIALQLSRKRLVDNTVARDIRRSATRRMNLVKCGDEKLMGVLLRITRHFCRDFPRCGEK